MQKTPALSTMLFELFTQFFDRDRLLKLARECGAVRRLRDIHPADLCASLLAASFGDEERSIASARRACAKLSGHSVEESAYYDRFTPELAALMRQLFCELLGRVDAERRNALVELIGEYGLMDVLAIDASQVMLPHAAAARFPSTSPEHGGLKLTATLSVVLSRIRSVVVTNARMHDRRALKLQRWLHGMLLIFDRGYCDHRLFADIEKRQGFFITRLKANSVPVVEAIRCGLGQVHIGKPLTAELPYRGTVDVDARFNIHGKQTHVFRVVRLVVEKEVANHGTTPVDVWLVTNLQSEQFSDEQVGLLYRLRWSVEKLFHVTKAVGRLDQLRSSDKNVIHAFLYSTLIGTLLAQDVCALMRAARPGSEPSLHRVALLVLGWLPDLARAFGSNDLSRRLAEFEQALWREGVNPNPGRQYMAGNYLGALVDAA